MAVIKQYIKDRLGNDCIKHYSDKKMYIERNSDKKMYIERNDELYVEAVDLVEYENERIYTETVLPIESEEFIDG